MGTPVTGTTAFEDSASASQRTTPIALTIAGSDSSGGAGIQADLKAFSALGVYGASVITALTAQNTQTVVAIHDVPPSFVVDQLNTVLSDLNVNAIKIGMLSSVAIIEAVVSVVSQHPDIPLIIDPVMVAKSGDALLQPDALHALKEQLCPLAEVVTPNIPEAALLLGCADAQTTEDMQQQATQLQNMGCRAVLLKGGHLADDKLTDVLQTNSGRHYFENLRIHTSNTHGTGCTLSSAIAAGRAKGLDLIEATGAAVDYLNAAIKAADALTIGHGHGPVHHFHALWTKD